MAAWAPETRRSPQAIDGAAVGRFCSAGMSRFGVHPLSLVPPQLHASRVCGQSRASNHLHPKVCSLKRRRHRDFVSSESYIAQTDRDTGPHSVVVKTSVATPIGSGKGRAPRSHRPASIPYQNPPNETAVSCFAAARNPEPMPPRSFFISVPAQTMAIWVSRGNAWRNLLSIPSVLIRARTSNFV